MYSMEAQYLFCGVHVPQFMTMKSAFVQMSIFGWALNLDTNTG